MLPIRYSDILSSDLIREYAAECGIPAIGKPDPQPLIYDYVEASGMMQCFGVQRVVESANYGQALEIGFATVLVSVLPHYGKKVATVESLFVTAHERKGLASGYLIKMIESHAEKSGCGAILYSAPAGGDFEAFLGGREEYARTNSVFCRRLA